MDWLYPLSGFVVGAIVGLTGMGGGSLMTPLLILLFGVHPLTAVGTDLVYAAATKTAGTLIHANKGHVEWRVAGVLAGYRVGSSRGDYNLDVGAAAETEPDNCGHHLYLDRRGADRRSRCDLLPPTHPQLCSRAC